MLRLPITTQTKCKVDRKSFSTILANFRGTLVRCRSRMERSHAKLRYLSRTWVVYKPTGTLRCQTTPKFSWSHGLTQERLAKSKPSKRKSLTRRSLRSSQGEDHLPQVNRWTSTCSTIQRKSVSTTLPSSSRFTTASLSVFALRERPSIDVLSSDSSNTPSSYLPCLLVFHYP